jgi:hypothetical protein
MPGGEAHHRFDSLRSVELVSKKIPCRLHDPQPAAGRLAYLRTRLFVARPRTAAAELAPLSRRRSTRQIR